MVLAAIATPSMALLGVISWFGCVAARAPPKRRVVSERDAGGRQRFSFCSLSQRDPGAAGRTDGLAFQELLHRHGMPYGSIVGGYRALFDGVAGWELGISAWLVFCMALPAVLPIVSLAGGAAFLLCPLQRNDALRSVLPYLMLCIAALVISIYPRADVEHLSFVAPLPYAVAGILAYRWVPTRLRAWLTLWMAVWRSPSLRWGGRSAWAGSAHAGLATYGRMWTNGRLVSGPDSSGCTRAIRYSSIRTSRCCTFDARGKSHTLLLRPARIDDASGRSARAGRSQAQAAAMGDLPDLDPVPIRTGLAGRGWPRSALPRAGSVDQGNYRASDLPPITGYVLMQRQQ